MRILNPSDGVKEFFCYDLKCWICRRGAVASNVSNVVFMCLESRI